MPPLAASLRFRYLQNHLDLEAPITRIYYIDNLYRQERPQKGSLRQSAKAQLREANRSGASAAVILGEDEVKKGTCTVKRMDTGEKEEVPNDKLAEHLDAILHPGPESS